MPINRRDFLWRTGLAAGALTLGGGLFGRVARAAGENDHYFVFAYFEGGWDILLSLDPRDPREFTDAVVRETGIQPGYGLLPPQYSRAPIDAGPFTLGPCVGELAALADHFSVVRGIDMSTLTHEVGRRYFITGQRPSGLTARGSSVATLATAAVGSDRPVPHLAHLVENYNADQPPFAAALPVASVDHLQYILQENLGIPTAIPANVKGALGAYWQQQGEQCDPDRGAGVGALADIYRDNRARARQVVTSQLHRSFQFNAAETAAVRRHYGFGEGQLETPYGRAALAAQALKTGLSRVVSVALSIGLDTHDGTWAAQHSTNLQMGFDALARLIRDLRDSEAPGGGSLYDKTTIVVFSEFARTPRLNERQGRDHHLANCALLAGGGIRGGRVVGRTSDRAMGPETIDLQSGQADPNGEALKPEHVLATALAAGGIDPVAALRVGPIPTLLDLGL
ncbi:MAG: DUF1501 domain-containing protein [Myxococcales bacterium]|nr:DUF1501 domain-containing protein [Myxococcales bacterium]